VPPKKHTQPVRHTKAGRPPALFVTALLCLACAPGPTAAAPPRPATPAATQAHHDRALAAARHIDGLASRVVAEAKVTGLAVGIVHGDQVLLERGYGLTRAGNRETVDADTVFRIASLSKAFAGTLAALLVREGALRWDSRIADQLPAFKLKDLQAAQELTVLDILSHRVGLPFHAYDRELEADQPYPLLVARLEEAPIACSPGDCYAYQNVAFSLIGDMVFAGTGSFYSYQVERRIFHPLGMQTATFGRDALEASERWARPHVRGRRGWVAVRPKETYYRIPPAAGVNASVRDLNQWLIAQLGGRPDVLPPAVLDEIQLPRVATPNEQRRTGWRGSRVRDAHYGLGWRVFDYAGHRLVFHAGAVQGYRGMIGFLPGRGFGIVVLWNAESAAPSGLMATALDRYLGLAPQDWTGLEGSQRRQGARR
jgi:beta-lactamase class C